MKIEETVAEIKATEAEIKATDAIQIRGQAAIPDISTLVARDSKPLIKAELIGILAVLDGLTLEEATAASKALTVGDINSAIRISIARKMIQPAPASISAPTSVSTDLVVRR